MPLEGSNDFVSFDYACGHCVERRPVVGFCTDCDRYLCSECYTTHLKPKSTRHHTLLDAGSMPRRPSCDPCPSDVPGNDELNQPRVTSRARAEHVRDIDVSSADDMVTPYITGMVVVVPGQSLAVVDGDNASVKLVELTRGTVQARLLLKRRSLWDIARLSDSRVVVTSYSEHALYLINVIDGRFDLDSEVKVSGECMGIACINDKLVTYTQPAKVEILDQAGHVLQTVVTPDTGERLFTEPWHVEVSRDQAAIYISDRRKHTVSRLSLTGEVLATYKNVEMLEDPLGLAVDKAGDVYVCGDGTNNVVQLTSDLTNPRQLPKTADGLKFPESACYYQATDTVYVGMWADVVKVFLLKP